MKISIDSDDFKAWHEVGHATVSLHLGGDLDSIELLEGDSRGFAVARGCYADPENEQSVACGGFAAEYCLLRDGHVAGVNLNDAASLAAVSDRLFSNAWKDHQDFIGRTVTEENDFTKEEKERFMYFAIERVAPILDQYFSKMQRVVNELVVRRRLEGARVREILQIENPS